MRFSAVSITFPHARSCSNAEYAAPDDKSVSVGEHFALQSAAVQGAVNLVVLVLFRADGRASGL